MCEAPDKFSGKSPTVSVCIPAYRQPELLCRAVQSVLDQTYRDFELIITDDSPGPEVRSAVAVLQDPRIRYWHNSTRLGPAGNWNEAVRRSAGAYVKFLHHDDFFPDRHGLATFVSMLEQHPEIDFAFSACLVCDAAGSTHRIHRPDGGQLQRFSRDPTHLYPANFVGAPSTTVFRRRTSATFDTHLKWLVDLDFYISVLRGRPGFRYCRTPLVSVTDGGQHQITNECLGNRDVELFEHLYVFSRLFRHRLPSRRAVMVLSRLLKTYAVTSTGDLPRPELLRLPWLLSAFIFARGRMGGSR